MKFFFRFFFVSLILFFLLIRTCLAWSGIGHVVIAQIAYDKLAPEVKQKVDKLASLFFNSLPSYEQQQLNHHYLYVSLFAKLAALPDYWGNLRVRELFISHKATLPPQFFGTSTTASWHYINLSYPDHQTYSVIQPYNIVWALQNIAGALLNVSDDRTKALFMVLMEHFVGDIHQPLHTINNVEYGYWGDLGGNRFCLQKIAGGRCLQNLHAFWDNGAGYLKPRINIPRYVYRLEKNFFVFPFISKLNIIAPLEWSKESYHLASFIYSLKEGSVPSKAYYKKTHKIVEFQLALAGDRLAQSISTNIT